MRERGRFRVGIILGLLAGIMASFAAMPVFIQDTSFLKGFLACLVFVSGVFVIKMTLKRRSVVNAYSDDRLDQGYPRILGILIIAFGLAIMGLLFFVIDDWMTDQKAFRERQIKAQSELSESIQKTGLLYLMRNVLDQVDEDLRVLPGRKLSNETISRIASLSYSFEPYVFIDTDSTNERKLSKERGQLLLHLISLNLDTSILKRIYQTTSFAGSDLPNSNLQGANLAGINLSGANLLNVNLEKAYLDSSNLRSCNLWGANLREASLNGADLNKSDLRWSDISRASLKEADLFGADLSSSQLRNTDFQNASLARVDLNGALLIQTNLNSANLEGTSWIRSVLDGADLRQTNMHYARFDETDLSGVDMRGVRLSGASVPDKNWLLNLNVQGADSIRATYILVDESSKRTPHFVFKKIK